MKKDALEVILFTGVDICVVSTKNSHGIYSYWELYKGAGDILYMRRTSIYERVIYSYSIHTMGSNGRYHHGIHKRPGYLFHPK